MKTILKSSNILVEDPNSQFFNCSSWIQLSYNNSSRAVALTVVTVVVIAVVVVVVAVKSNSIVTTKVMVIRY